MAYYKVNSQNNHTDYEYKTPNFLYNKQDNILGTVPDL